jgi:PIN domain nuclease of toxin-antitoxin system
VRFLLDTHIALWAVTDNPRLPVKAKAWIADPDNEIVISAATIWEIAIKSSTGRKQIPISGAEALEIFQEAGFGWLDVTPEHAAQVEQLPPIHQDPFDRLLVAQAMLEPMRLISHDTVVARYGSFVEHV